MGNAVDGLNKQEPTPSSSRKRAPVIWPGVLIFTTWTIALLAVLTNRPFLLDHRYLLQQSHLPWIVALVIFLASWQVMTVAMMLPSSMPVVSMMAYASKRQRHPWAIQGAFLGGYAVIWTAFAFTAFLVDTLVHQLVNHWGWLYTHSWLIGAVTFAIAGGFQFSLLKEHCLKQCRYTSKEALELHNVVLCSGYFRPLSSTCTL